MGIIFSDDEELQFIDEHFRCHAEDYLVSTWTIELLVRQNIL